MQGLGYAQTRIAEFTAGLLDPTQASYHTQQAVTAFMKGGWTGVGLGRSEQKFGALPAPHTDSIFAIIGEELGVLGAMFVLILFAAFAFRGFQIARRARDTFGALLCIGFTSWVIIQALLNIAVMTALIPSTGVPLPFISFGGSSLMVVMIGVGLMLSVQRVAARRQTTSERRNELANYDRGWGNRRARLSRTSSRRALLNDDNRHRLYFIGTVGGMEQTLAAESGLGFAGCHGVYAGPIHGVNPLRLLTSVIKLALGSLQSFVKLSSIRPQVILLTGGWANLPVAVGAWPLKIPIVLYLPDIEPGLTIKVLQRFAAKVAITVKPSARYFPAEKNSADGLSLAGESTESKAGRGD